MACGIKPLYNNLKPKQEPNIYCEGGNLVNNLSIFIFICFSFFFALLDR
jgi:hypothetical protein